MNDLKNDVKYLNILLTTAPTLLYNGVLMVSNKSDHQVKVYYGHIWQSYSINTSYFKTPLNFPGLVHERDLLL